MTVSGLFRIFFGIVLTASTLAQHTSVAQAGNAARRLAASNDDTTIMQACERMADVAPWARGWACTPAIYFTDNKTQRRSIPELRRRRERDPESLTEEDHAILHAANRIGMLAFNGCKNQGNGSITANAFLVRIDGQDALVSSLHQLFDPNKNGLPKNECSYEELTRSIVYFPNASYIEGENLPPSTMDEVSVTPHPSFDKHLKKWLDHGSFSGTTDTEADWMIYLLSEQISDQAAPDGYIRGFLKPSPTDLPYEYIGYTLGFDPRFSRETGVYQASYQKCDFRDLDSQTWHSCNISKGSSSSLLGILEDGEIRFRALHNLGASKKHDDAPLPTGPIGRNIGLSYETIEAEASVEFDHDWGQRADLLAYDIQWLLFRAGFYTGKLDNQWGPACREALTTFAKQVGLHLPGTDPSEAVLRALARVPEMQAARSTAEVNPPYEIHRLLQEAGCYSGKLDAAWGATSRKALADFNEHLILAVPTTEPSDELLAALETMSSSVQCD